MRVALVWYGQVREFTRCRKSWETFLNIHKPDIFIHTWQYDLNIHVGHYNIKSLLVEESTDLDHLKDGVTEYSSSAINVLPQMYSIKKASELKTEYERLHGFQYDWVMRSRIDIALNNPGGVQFAQMSPRRVHITHNHWTNIEGMYDDNLMVTNGDDYDYITPHLFEYTIRHIKEVRSIPSGEQLLSRFINERIWRDKIYKNPDLDFTLGRHL